MQRYLRELHRATYLCGHELRRAGNFEGQHPFRVGDERGAQQLHRGEIEPPLHHGPRLMGEEVPFAAREQRGALRRRGAEAKVQLRDDAEGAEPADLELGEIVARHVLHDRAARADHASVAGHDGSAEQVVPHRAVPVPQGAGRAGRHHGANRAIRLPRRVDGKPGALDCQLLLEHSDGDARLDRGDQVGRGDLHHAVHRAGRDAEVGGRVGRHPAALAFRPDPPAVLVRQAAHLREAVQRVGGGDRLAVAVPADHRLAEGVAQADENLLAHATTRVCDALAGRSAGGFRPAPDHSRQRCRGIILRGFARWSGSNTCRTAHICRSVVSSKMSGM